MARSLSLSKLLAASVADGLSLSVNKRGYAVASQASVSASFGRGTRGAAMGKPDEKAATPGDAGASSAWVPDPVTGYYRPINHTDEIDAVELREMLLNQRVRPY